MFYKLDANQYCIHNATPIERVGMDRWLTTTQGLVIASLLSIGLFWVPLFWLVLR